ncbi:type II secretion system protein GspM [Vibrio breoganii]|uniref:Type II secretion system protein M n=1 Tax=Vibrio breoganii TaxID=553239 RepID=A0AAJ3SBS8_9VIBR|nr:type II secretion system protein M [Vibrio breoganii]ANO31816.1 general secretion pathway protein GspM [Vibrio breoganii]MDN3714544.1 type II secretion system protein M [Vibrio breoganii]NMO73692.1 type II secretion system protein M [Vibrio breoganii]NMR70231.1 type II secretion system protein M [Vibrio breoganii]OCH74550.1 general secretion pathway protein GspM [Vibrio breoganii]
MRGLQQAILGYWSSISLREQRMLIIAIGFGVAGLLYWGGFAPLKQKNELAQARLISETQLLSWVQKEANAITELRKTSGAPSISNEPLNQLLSTSTGRFNIELIRLQPRDDMVQVWVQPVAFNRLMNWLLYLRQEKGVDVAFFDINETEKKGVVEVKRLQFKRAGS